MTIVIEGPVIRGDRRGRQLGYPTANIRVDDVDTLPPFGVYAGWADGRPAAVSIGVRPTFGEDLEPLMEAHLLDYEADLYGQELTVELVDFVRPEERFPDADALAAQMREDVRRVREVLRDRPRPGSDPLSVAVRAFRARGSVVVLDDLGGSGGALTVPAVAADAAAINLMAREARGLVCLALTPNRCARLGLAPMRPQDDPGATVAMTVSIEAREGVSTGISAADRARTIAAAVAPGALPRDVVTPGHVFPVQTAPGGLSERPGHAEAAVELAQLAGFAPAGAFCVVLDEDGEVADAAALTATAERLGVPLVRTSEVAAGCRAVGPAFEIFDESVVRTEDGFELDRLRFRRPDDATEHVALTRGDVAGRADVPAWFGRLDPLAGMLGEMGPAAAAAAALRAEEHGVVVLIADADGGRDSQLSSPVAAQLLRLMGVQSVRPLMPGAAEVFALAAHGVPVRTGAHGRPPKA